MNFIRWNISLRRIIAINEVASNKWNEQFDWQMRNESNRAHHSKCAANVLCHRDLQWQTCLIRLPHHLDNIWFASSHCSVQSNAKNCVCEYQWIPIRESNYMILLWSGNRRKFPRMNLTCHWHGVDQINQLTFDECTHTKGETQSVITAPFTFPPKESHVRHIMRSLLANTRAIMQIIASCYKTFY